MRSLKIFLFAISIAALLAASGLSLLTGSNPTNCGGGFGLYSCNVRTITLSSAALYGGRTASTSFPATSSISIVLNNPGAARTIASLTLTEYGLSPIASWSSTSNGKNMIDFQSPYSKNYGTAISASSVTTFILYPLTNDSVESIIPNQICDYLVSFANAQLTSGSLVAQ
ncbi:MAG: hypothetical protein ACRECH_11835 [Nitrososphaerales archaeon]